MSLEEVLQHPELSVEAKALFLMILSSHTGVVDSEVAEIHWLIGTEVPDVHWWTQRTTKSLIYELAYFGVYTLTFA